MSVISSLIQKHSISGQTSAFLDGKGKCGGGRKTLKQMGQVRGQLQVNDTSLRAGQQGCSAVLVHQGRMA